MASGIMNSGRENCSAIASASSMWVSVQKKQALPMAPNVPRRRCMPGRLVRSASSGSRQNSGSTNRKPMSERKNRISIAGSSWPRCFTSVAITTSVSEPVDTSVTARATSPDGGLTCGSLMRRAAAIARPPRRRRGSPR